MAVLPVVLCGPLLAQDIDGEDHPALPRYPHAVIDGYRAPSLDEVTVPIGPIANAEAPTNRRLLEGKVTHIDYRVKPATAPLQIQRYYDDLLKQRGFSVAYACVGPACGRDMGSLILNSGKVAPTGLADGLFNDKIRVVVAHRADTWVVLHIAEGPDRSQIFEAVVEGASAR
ncbi:hypothetical protein [Sphingomonas sanxanigenens]|uniref:DUF4892 domain-containing protein n=1 Tax=Sphingomonas sanxanigenens DSM 19645 = NX02 TaxID=1123269 RepID=W0A9S4_9SPHN|nr:hypothetical protein [Sphingomonas sanxanigenens]AHE53058.1 hypothetical protein NX02_06640 [Sphingomonas sanxanigenens DSM 19645 = NX02]